MIGRQILGNVKRAIDNEWLMTNGLGGYSSSTVINSNTRRFHGLLIASMMPPVKRWLLLNRLEEEVTYNNKNFSLSTNLYLDAVHPKGYIFQENFEFKYFPVFNYLIDSVRIKKEIILFRNKNTVLIKYTVLNNRDNISFTLTPIVSMRDIHETILMGKIIISSSKLNTTSCIVRRQNSDDSPNLFIKSDKAVFANLNANNRWYLNFRYYQDENRGESFFEDGYAPGRFNISFKGNGSFCIVASTDDFDINSIDKEVSKTLEHWISLEPEIEYFDSFFRQLHYAADQFIVQRMSTSSQSVIAGYPWFTDWGRDTMISLPGLTLATGRFKDAASILDTYARYCSKGMLPNRFPDSGEEPEYNNVDSAYWFFYAALKYLQYTSDFNFIQERIYPVLKEIANSTIDGTRFNIKMDASDGLISAGNSSTQLTWMDVKINDQAVTPRYGKAVEINALWYNALSFLSYLCRKFGDISEGHRWHSLSQKVRVSFLDTFSRDKMGLFDIFTLDGPDKKIRPNQLISIFLPYKIVSKEKAKEIFNIVEDSLYTSYGIRTLHPRDPEYKPFYRGLIENRDKAYHQGTAWAFLTGFYVTSFLSIYGRNDENIKKMDLIFKPFKSHISEYGIGTISEVFEGEPPHRADGCIAQAWSVAEILRSYYEDFLGLAPELPELKDTFK
jgi:predicted glycogen debranching enzyme